MFHAANLFLSTNYEKCRQVCSVNYSFVSNSDIFEANLVRFKALALEQIYQQFNEDIQSLHAEHIKRLTPEQNTELLLDAIEATQNAIEITRLNFSKTNMPIGLLPNNHGTALAEFQLGHLYEKYVVTLTVHQESEDKQFNERFKKHAMVN